MEYKVIATKSNKTARFNKALQQPEVDTLKEYGIDYVYHMTHISNLANILKNDLLSHNLAHQRFNIVDISNPTVNAYRKAKDPIYGLSLHDYVPTYLNPKNPMSYVRREEANNYAILKLNKKLLLQTGAIFTDGNAACINTSFYNDITDLDQLDWECLHAHYWADFIDGKRKRNAELLVPQTIPAKYIEEIAIKNVNKLRDMPRLNNAGPKIIIAPEIFF